MKYIYLLSIQLFIFNNLYSQIQGNDIYISSGPDTIYLREEIVYESMYDDWLLTGYFVDYWNWSINIIHSDEIYPLTKEDSVMSVIESTWGWKIGRWITRIDSIPFPYDSIKNDLENIEYLKFLSEYEKNPNMTLSMFRSLFPGQAKSNFYYWKEKTKKDN